MKRLLRCMLVGVVSPLVTGCGPAANPPTSTVAPAPGGLVAGPAETAPAPTVRVKAGVGSGKKGRSLDQHSGIVVTPAKTLFAAKEKIKFEIEIPHALQLYKALEGNAPRTHEEFMEKIIKANNISLPELPEGHKYIYDPMTETLMVEKPAQ